MLARPWLPLLTALLLTLPTTTALSCPNCKESLAQGASRDSPQLGNGLSTSVLFMLAVPFTLFGTGAFAVLRAARRGSLPPL